MIGEINIGAAPAVSSGWDNELGKPRSTCVTPKRGKQVPERSNTLSVDAKLEAVTSAQEVIERYTNSVAGSYEALSGGGSAEVKRARDGKLTSYRTYSFLTSTVRYVPARGLEPGDFELTKVAQSLLDHDGGLAVFRLTCGDRFVTKIHEGGRFEVRLEISSNSSEVQKSVTQTLQVAAADGKLSADDEESLRTFSNEGRLDYEVSSTPALPEIPKVDPDKLIAAWRSYQDVVKSAQDLVVVGVELHSYDGLVFAYLANRASERTWPPIPDWVRQVRDEFDHMKRLFRLHGDLIYIRDHTSEFVYHDRTQIEKAIVEVGKEMEAVRFWAMNCILTSGGTCAQRGSHRFVPPSPARTTGGWIEIDPLNGGPQFIGGTRDHRGILEVTGKFQIANDGRTADATWDWSEIQLRSLSGGGSFKPITPAPSYASIPPFIDVYYRLWDTYWVDNRKVIEPSQRARARVGEVLDVSEWTK